MSVNAWWAAPLMAGIVAVQAPAMALAQGGAPSVAAAPADARTLGLVDSEAHYCASHDPSAAERVRARVQQVERGVGTDAVAAYRASPAYRAAYDAETAFLARVDDRNASRVCEGRAIRRKTN